MITPAKEKSSTGGCIGCLGVFLVVMILGAMLQRCDSGHDSAPSGSDYYQKQITDGVKAVDPDHQLSPEERQMIRKTADEVAKEYPR